LPDEFFIRYFGSSPEMKFPKKRYQKNIKSTPLEFKSKHEHIRLAEDRDFAGLYFDNSICRASFFSHDIQ
jgi:hypothetical protein